jgi:hypothetical protein
MAFKYRLAQRGERTVYIEHGVWYDAKTKHIHVTVPGAEGAHWSYGKTDKKYPLYRAMLEEVDRWPVDAG